MKINLIPHKGKFYPSVLVESERNLNGNIRGNRNNGADGE